CRVISKEIEHRLVLTRRRCEIEGFAGRGRSRAIGVTKLADILKPPVEKYVACRRRRRILAVWPRSGEIEIRIVERHAFYPVGVTCPAIVDDRNSVAIVAVVRRVGVRIIQIIGVVLINDRRSDIERVPHVIDINNATIRRGHGIVDDLEKVRVVGWQRVELVEISPMTVIVGISEASTGREGSVYPYQAKELSDVGMPLLAEGVTYTVITGPKPGIRYHSLQVIHVEPCGG